MISFWQTIQQAKEVEMIESQLEEERRKEIELEERKKEEEARRKQELERQKKERLARQEAELRDRILKNFKVRNFEFLVHWK